MIKTNTRGSEIEVHQKKNTNTKFRNKNENYRL